jgi:beta-glucan synthesis-associated protein KRE6
MLFNWQHSDNASHGSPVLASPTNSLNARPRSQSRGGMTISRLESENSQALGGSFSSLGSGQRGSMVLYRLAAEDDTGELLRPKLANNRDSVASRSGDWIFSLSSDWKYPSGVTYGGSRVLVPYAYDPAINNKGKPSSTLAWRGFLNVGVLFVLISSLLCLFIFHPILMFIRNNALNRAVDGHIRINVTGRAPAL